MPDYYEINIHNLETDEYSETIYLNDEFFYYLYEFHPYEKELYYSIPVMGPDDFDFNDYKKELNKFPPYKGIFTTSLNYLNNYGIKELIKNVELWIPIVENIDAKKVQDFDIEKEPLLNELKKLLEMLNEIPADNSKYLILWAGL